MRSLASRSARALVVGAALVVLAGASVGCSSSGARSAPTTAVKHSITEGQTYVASPTQHWRAVSDTRKREAEAAKAEARTRGGAAATPVARPSAPARTYPEPTARAQPAAAAPAAPAPAVCAPPPSCEELCPGGKCGIPAPAFCCDPCGPGGKCGIPAPAVSCFGR